jgi:hypothetical protein
MLENKQQTLVIAVALFTFEIALFPTAAAAGHF